MIEESVCFEIDDWLVAGPPEVQTWLDYGDANMMSFSAFAFFVLCRPIIRC